MLNLERFLPYRLSLVSNLISQGIAETYERTYSMSVTEWRVIAVLGRFPGITASEVVRRTAMDKVAISRTVRRLLEKGLLEREDNDDDRRSKKLFLSRQGERIYRRVAPAAVAFEARLLEVLSESEQAALARLLDKLTEAASDMVEGDHKPLPPR